MGATHQCIVKWPGWMSSKEAMGHVSSFMFGHFLLSGPKRNMYPWCGNTFWQDSKYPKNRASCSYKLGSYKKKECIWGVSVFVMCVRVRLCK